MFCPSVFVPFNTNDTPDPTVRYTKPAAPNAVATFESVAKKPSIPPLFNVNVAVLPV